MINWQLPPEICQANDEKRFPELTANPYTLMEETEHALVRGNRAPNDGTS